MEKSLTVGELIEHLKTFRANLPVGVVGHFGEFHPMRKYHFDAKGATVAVNSDKFIDVFCIEPPDIGPEPD